MAGVIDEICPPYVGEDRIVVTIDPDANPRAFSPFVVKIDYSACDPEGVVPPIEVFLRAPSDANCERRIHRSSRPETAEFKPREGGLHLVLVRELHHNRWWGRLRVMVAGERLRMASRL